MNAMYDTSQFVVVVSVLDESSTTFQSYIFQHISSRRFR